MKRRDFIRIVGTTGAGVALMPGGFVRKGLRAAPAAPGLSDPALQPMFANPVPDALSPAFIYQPVQVSRKNIKYEIMVGTAVQKTGLINPATGAKLDTPVWGYGDLRDKLITWPGRTFLINSASAGGPSTTEVQWTNALNGVPHLLPVDTSLHWCYSLPGYEQYSIDKNGVPIITHLHGGHTDFLFDGNPEFFYGPRTKGKQVTGPQWNNYGGGFTDRFRYDNNIPAGNLWYHDHALGITRLNVYAGMAGFYFVRDNYDTGLPGNPLDLPAWPYEKAYAIQDRMFLETGQLFYPSMPGDPYYDDFINGEGAVLPSDIFPGGGPTALAEFFGDHIVVNGVIWPYEEVEPRNYRLHLLNGTDSRFIAIQLFEVPANATDFSTVIQQLDFLVVGSDQGLASAPSSVTTLLSEPGSRYDIVVDFSQVTPGNRVIMKNIAGDEPFGGDIPGPQIFGETDRIMAFDVKLPLDVAVPDATPTGISFGPNVPATPTRLRKVALFEGKDEYGRLQPLLGTAEPATDFEGNPIDWPNTTAYVDAGLVGQMNGAIAWHSPTTENPALGSTEEWEIWNATGDAHPVHLHLVHFEVLGRQEIVWDSATNEDDRVLDPAGITAPAPNGDGTYLVTQPVVQHNGSLGNGFRFASLTYGAVLSQPSGYVENTPKDMVTALPGQIIRIKATFDKPGRYVWHCHILSHEDHEMMRVLHVGRDALAKRGALADATAVPDQIALDQNYPNPFNPTTNIRFQLSSDEHVELNIYNMFGQKVRTLVNGRYSAGYHTIIWDSKDNNGRSVASGTYIYKMTAGKFTQTKKMSLVR